MKYLIKYIINIYIINIYIINNYELINILKLNS